MTATTRRVLQLACFAISTAAIVHPLAAQKVQLSQAAVAEIVSEVFRAILPPSDSLSRVPNARRTMLFDYERTMAAFGYADTATARPDLRTPLSVAAGSASLLTDCNQTGTKPCQRLGWNAYVWIEPRSLTNSQAVVRGHVRWIERGTPFTNGAIPSGRASLVGFTTDVHLARAPNGQWRFLRNGTTIVGD